MIDGWCGSECHGVVINNCQVTGFCKNVKMYFKTRKKVLRKQYRKSFKTLLLCFAKKTVKNENVVHSEMMIIFVFPFSHLPTPICSCGDKNVSLSQHTGVIPLSTFLCLLIMSYMIFVVKLSNMIHH